MEVVHKMDYVSPIVRSRLQIHHTEMMHRSVAQTNGKTRLDGTPSTPHVAIRPRLTMRNPLEYREMRQLLEYKRELHDKLNGIPEDPREHLKVCEGLPLAEGHGELEDTSGPVNVESPDNRLEEQEQKRLDFILEQWRGFLSLGDQGTAMRWSLPVSTSNAAHMDTVDLL